MTGEEYKDRMRDIKERMSALEDEKRVIMREYVDSLPFKADDIVRIDNCSWLPERDKTVWVYRVEPRENTDMVDMYVNKRRKDGSQSRIQTHLMYVNAWQVSVIEKAGK